MSERSGAGVRAIDHVGVTVPDIEEAARFFAEALGAEPLYEMAPSQPPTEDNLRLEQAQLGTRPGTRWRGALMMRLGDGPCIELFDYEDPYTLAGKPDEECEWDGIAEEWFPTEAAFNAVYGRENRDAHEDSVSNTGRIQRLVVKEITFV